MKKPSTLERQNAKKKTRSVQLVGVTWYTEPEWARVKGMATDPERFEATFGEWTTMAEGALVDFMKVGIAAIKVNINADELASWCATNSNENNAAARAAFVSERLRTQNGTDGYPKVEGTRRDRAASRPSLPR